MPVDPGARRAVAHRLSAAGVQADSTVIVMHVSAGNPFRRWPESSFAELAAALVRTAARRHVVLTSGPSDAGAAARVVASARARTPEVAARLHDLEGLSLQELRALFERAALFIGGDSGPLHVASTSDVPVVGLYGPTLPGRSAPWRPASVPTASVDAGPRPCRPCAQRTCLPGDFRCLTGIDAGAVHATAERLLDSTR
jgi:ADP-heptose:LPS heptosyltransferase